MDIRITHVISLDASLMAMLAASVSGAALAGSPGKPYVAPKPLPDAPQGGTEGDGPQATALKDAGLPAAGAAATDAGTADATGVDAGGWPWSSELHASTKTKTKEGFWRMKVGVSRPDPKPGFEAPATGTAAASETPAAGASATTAAAAPAGDDEDEFAAFRAAADKAGATDAAAAAAVPARKWTDADLGALCNQAATKLGDPAPIKAVIAEFVPEGQVPHSRNIPDDKRADFAKAVEAKAGIEFAG